MLRFISDEAARRELQFQIGIWTHAYQWTNSPRANYTIEGLTPETQGPYCREALRILLMECPNITGLTIRTHGESGVAEGNTGIWKTIFDGVSQCGRKVEIDLHAKGMDPSIIEAALATGMPLTISPKFWAEHMGLPYMQGSIRAQEMPPPHAHNNGFFSRSSGSRSFLRYGYGDLLTENRRYGVLHRIWPGTQRTLLWADPEIAAAYGRVASFCGSNGVEICEPLSFKGRKGSGLPGGAMRTRIRNWRRNSILKNTNIHTASGAGIFTIPRRTLTAGGGYCARTLGVTQTALNKPFPPPEKFCRSSRRRIALRLPTIITGPRCTGTCR